MHELQNTLGTGHDCQIKEASVTPESAIYMGVYLQKKKVMANFTVAEI